MFGLGRRGDSPLYGALIDVGSGTIGMALVESDLKRRLPTIIYMDRITMRVGKRGSDENVRRVREMLLNASLSFSQESQEALRNYNDKARVKELCISVSAPWSSTIAHAVEYTDDEPFRVTPAILGDLVESAESAIMEKVRKERKDEEGFDIVERATTNIAINEYPVENPLNLEGTMLSLSHVVGLIPTSIIHSLTEIQEKLYPDTRLHAHTAMLVMYSAVRDLFPRVHTYCIVNVTSEATEFGIIEEDVLVENIFVPHGTDGFITSIMESTGKPAADVHTALRAFGTSKGTEDAKLRESAEPYLKGVVLGISAIMEKRAFPEHVVVTAHEPYQDFFRYLVGEAVRTETGKKPGLFLIDRNLTKEIAHGRGEDVYLAVGARFFHKLHGTEKKH